MSVSKLPQLKEKQRQNTKKSSLQSQNVDQQQESKHEDDRNVAGRSALKRSLVRDKDKHVNNSPKAKKKNFVIPRKNNQAKELLQSLHFDSREVKDLLRHVKLSFRHQSSASTFKYEKVEFVHNEKLSHKYAEKKQELRLELAKNREIEEKYAFLYTQSRTKAKTICEHGLQTGHCQLSFLGDPKLGIYLCRYTDILYKRPLDVKDSGYLIVFNIMKGRVKGISGGNPEQQPTPHHDCHVSKLFTNLSSTASHGDVYGASQFYFYEIDENSEDFHAKQPRQALPYAVLTFSIVKPEDPQTLPLNEKPEEKNLVQRHDMSASRTDKNTVSSPVTEDDLNETIQCAFNVSWTGQLFFKNKFIAFINLLSYSRKKQLLPDYVEQRITICKKMSQENLKSLYKYPIFRNGKPCSTGLSKEFGSSGKFIYYEVQPVITQEREKFDKLMSYLVKENAAAVIQYYDGSVHMYIMPTSQLTHDCGITDERSPMILHALVHVKRLLPFPVNHEIQQPSTSDDTSSSEDNIRKQFQAIFGEKYKTKSEKRHTKIPSLLSKEILLNSRRTSDKIPSKSAVEEYKSKTHTKCTDSNKSSPHKSLNRSESCADSNKSSSHKSLNRSESCADSNKSSPHKSLNRSESWNGHGEHDHRHGVHSSHSSRYKWQNPKLLQSSSSVDSSSSKNTSTQEQLTTITEEQQSRDEASKTELDQQSNDKGMEMTTSIDLAEVQKLIEHFKKQANSLTAGFTTRTTHSPAEDPRLQPRPPSNTDVTKSIPPPPIPPPPPPPPPLSPVVTVVSPPLPCTPSASIESLSTSEATPPPTVSTLSTFSPLVPQSKGILLPECSKTSVLPSPPHIERKQMTIPGLETPGSPIFDLIKDKKVSSVSKTRRCYFNDSSPKSLPPSPLVCTVDSSKAVTPPIQSPQPVPVAVKKITTSSPQTSSSGISDKLPQGQSSLGIHVKPRHLTKAEKTASKAMKEVMNILERNAHVQAAPQDIPPLATKTITTEDFKVKIKSILKTSKDKVKSKESINKPTLDNVVESPNSMSSSTANKPSIKELHKDKESAVVKVVSLDEYRNKCLLTPEKQSINNINSNSPCTPELKSGLDLLDNLISNDESQSRSQSIKDRKITMHNKKEEQFKKEAKCLPKKRRRIVTVKSKTPAQPSSGWDDMTSDISDDELPEDKITSDISDTELPDDYMETVDDKKIERGNHSRSSRSCELTPSSHHKTQHHHEEYEKRYHDCRSTQTKSEPSSRSYQKSRSSSRSISPIERDRERKRRRMDVDQSSYQKDVHANLCDNNSNDSGSPMSISPINSPVSFEYNIPTEGTFSSSAMSISPTNSPVSFEYAIPTEGTYRSVIASPLPGRGNLDVTVVQGDCTGGALGGMSVLRSPTEIDMVESPGTPETAVPAEDFLHANIGYWSSEFTTKGLVTQMSDFVPAYGEMGYLETHDDRQYETANQGDIQHSYHQDETANQGDTQYSYHHDETANQGDTQHSYHHDENANQGDTQYSYHHDQTANQGDTQHSYHQDETANQGDTQHSYRHDENANQGDIQHSYRQDNISEEGWSSPPPRPYSPYSPTKLSDDNADDSPSRTPEEDHITQGYHLRRCRSIGESSGYESPSYLDLRRPFFGTTDDTVPSMYDKNVNCTEDNNNYKDKYIDRYPTLPTRTDDLCGSRELYYISRSPYGDIDSPRTVDSMDGRDSPRTPEYDNCHLPEGRNSPTTPEYDNRQLPGGRNSPTTPEYDNCHLPEGRNSPTTPEYNNRQLPERRDSPRTPEYDNRQLPEGRNSPITPEYMDSKYLLDRKIDDNYEDYYRSLSDIDDGFEQRIATYDRELDPYQNERDYFSDEEPSHYFDHEEDIYYSPVDQDPQGLSRPHAEYERDYQSDNESLTSSDYYDHDSYQYLDDMAQDDISTTMFEMDQVVCDGINGFPAQLLNLSNYSSNYNSMNQEEGDNPAGAVSVNQGEGDNPAGAVSVNQGEGDNPAGAVSVNQGEGDNRAGPAVESSNNKVINHVSTSRDPRLNKNINVRTTNNANQKEKKAVKPLPRVQSYFYVYNLDNDIECESVENYMLKTGAQYLDVSDEAKLKSLRGACIRVLIRTKHKSALHKISNLSKLKCLRNVKFALFNTVEDVVKKTRAYTAVFQYGGVLLPDDLIMKRVHPAYLEALLRFMRTENIMHQKVFWVMNIRYQAYKKLVGSQRPLTWRDTFVLDLLRKYRNEGFVNIIHKEYVTEGLSLVQRYLDTAWKQQRDLLTTYRHFIMLSNMNKQRLEASWFRNRGIGFMDIKTFLLAFAGEKKLHQLLSRSIFTEDSNTGQTNTMDSSSSTAKNTKLFSHSEVENRRMDLDKNRIASSNMVSWSAKYTPSNNMKETRLEILSSINSVKDNLLNSMGSAASNSKDITPSKTNPKEIVRKDVTYYHNDGDSSKDTSRKETAQLKGGNKTQVTAPQKGSSWSRTVRSVNSKDYAPQRGDSPRRRRESPYQSRTVSNVDHVDRKHVKDRLSTSHPRNLSLSKSYEGRTMGCSIDSNKRAH